MLATKVAGAGVAKDSTFYTAEPESVGSFVGNACDRGLKTCGVGRISHVLGRINARNGDSSFSARRVYYVRDVEDVQNSITPGTMYERYVLLLLPFFETQIRGDI